MIRVCFGIVLAVLLTSRVVAQTGGAIEGTIRDATGAPIAGARVETTVAGRSRSATSDTAGRYRFDALPSGIYRIVATHAGLAPGRADVTVTDAGNAVVADLTLGSVVASETVSVEGVNPGATLDTPAKAGSRLGLTPRETPATLNVLSFVEAQSRGLSTTTEALTRVPGVSAANLPSTFATSMRGFTAAAISTLYDGTRSTTSSMVMRNFDSWTFERIEVLKGPASVLYGEGALAGAVNFVTKRPDFSRRHNDALISTGSFGQGRAAFGSTGPLGSGDRTAYRLDAVVTRNGGYVDDTDFTAFNGSGTLDYKLSSSVTLSASVDHFVDKYQTSYWGTPLVPAAVARDASDVINDSRGFVLDRAMRKVNFEVDDARNHTRATWLRGRLEWRLSDNWKLSDEIYGYDARRVWRNADTYGFDAAQGLVTRASTSITHEHDFFGNRLMLASNQAIAGRRNRLSFGLETTRNTFFMPRRFGTTTSVDPFAPQRGTFPAETSANFPGAGNFVNFGTKLTIASVFAEDALTIAPRVTVVAGGRLDQFDVDRRVDDLNTGLQTAFGHLFKPASGRVGVVVDVAEKTQLFAQVTSAVAPVSTVPIISQTNARFDLTTGRSWETGVKGTLAGGRIELTAAAFEVAQDNILTRDPNNANITIQGGQQSSRGVELTLSALPISALRVDAHASFMRAQFDELVEAGGANRAGNVPTNVPERGAGVWATYRFNDWPLTIAGGVRGQGRYFANTANTVGVDGYALVDAQASWRVGPGDVTIRGKNLTNAFYVEWAVTANQVLSGMPRSLEASYQFRF